tara:strand:- start:152 stop:310 length:159 start_codon:yes stop_codon:yes gene_type:complete
LSNTSAAEKRAAANLKVMRLTPAGSRKYGIKSIIFNNDEKANHLYISSSSIL